jgi:hypothetical protein
MKRSVGQTVTTGYDRKPLQLESITFTIQGKMNRGFLAR